MCVCVVRGVCMCVCCMRCVHVCMCVCCTRCVHVCVKYVCCDQVKCIRQG